MRREATLARLSGSRHQYASSALLKYIGRRVGHLWQKVVKAGQRSPRALRLCESVNLGDRRFIAVVEYERWRFLVGGTSGSLVLLANLNPDMPQASGAATSCAASELENGQ
jgi:flagellar biogenesis protein FliO